tara:strand:+ start:856 stop:1086 length:231 start_codon:yes stop_codon:yes gene_type:complete
LSSQGESRLNHETRISQSQNFKKTAPAGVEVLKNVSTQEAHYLENCRDFKDHFRSIKKDVDTPKNDDPESQITFKV